MIIRFFIWGCVIGLCILPCLAIAQKDTLSLPVVTQQVSGEVKSIATSLGGQAISKVKLLTEGKLLSAGGIKLSVEYTYLRDTSGITAGLYKSNQGIASYSAAGNLLIKGIPFALSFDGNNGFYTADKNPLTTYYKANFDPKQYRETVKAQVLDKIKPEVVLGSILTRIDNIRHEYERSLLNELSNIQEEFAGQFKEELKLPDDVADISSPDLSALRNKILQGNTVEKYSENIARLQELAMHNQSAGKIDSFPDANGILRDAKRFEALQKVYNKVLGTKEKFEGNTLVKELKSHLPFTPDKFKSYLSNPANLADVIRKHGDISTLQSLFLNITKLDIGQNPVQSGELSIQNLMNTGVNTAFQNKKSSIGFIAGTNNSTNYWMQSGLNNLVSNEYSGMTGFTLGKGGNGNLNHSLSLNVFNFMRSAIPADGAGLLNPSYLGSPARQDAVITFHTGYKIKTKHEINFDVSRSMGTYRNHMTEDSSYYTKGASGAVLGKEGQSNFAAMVNYKGEVLKTALEVTIRKVGLGYSNPGNIFLRRGETGLQMAVNKKLFRKKLTLGYKTDLRHQHFDPEKKYTYLTFTNKMQASVRIKRNTRAGISYQHSEYRSGLPMQQLSTGGSSILQANGFYRLNLLKKGVMNNVIVSRQQMKLPLPAGAYYNSSSVLVVHNSSLQVNKNMLVFSLMVNESDNKDYYFNTSFRNAELNYTYGAGGKMIFTSGTGYYINNGWNNQLGLRQQLSVAVLKKMDINVGVDVKRAIKTIRPELADQIFVNASVHYRFN